MALLKLKERNVEAYSVARHPENFSQLDSDLDGFFGANWAGLTYEKAGEALGRGELSGSEIVIACVEQDDEDDLKPIEVYIKAAKRAKLPVIIVARDVSSTMLHHLLQLGADDFAPYPLPHNALANIFERLSVKREQATASEPKRRNRHGLVIPVYSAAGGVGATTFATNLAWEMAQHTRKSDQRVALVDFDFQYGSVATLLDLPRRDAVYELLSDTSSLDGDTLAQAMTSFKSTMAVLSAPPEAMPLDIVRSEDIEKILTLLRERYDFIIVDLPRALTDWSGTILTEAETFFCLLELDMRSAQNLMRYLRALRAEDLPGEKIQYVLNHAPGITNLNGKSRIARFSESLGVEIKILLPDGGSQVSAAADHGVPLSDFAPKNSLRKEIRKIATTIVDLATEARAAIAT